MGSTVQPQTATVVDLKPSAISQREARSHKIRWIWHLLHLSPFLLLAWFVLRFSVNAPYLDEWRFAHLFHAIRFKQATFADFFALNYEHRLLFPKLIWIPLGLATHWNLRVEMMVNLIPALVIFLVFYWLAAHQAKQIGSTFSHLTNFSTSLVLFSLVQYETWLWGIGGAFLLVHAAFALALGVCFTEKLRPWTRFGLAAFFCFVASFSSAHGLFSWLALLPCILLLQTGPRKAIKISLWGFLFAASIALYAYRYEFFLVPEASSQFDFLYHPLRSAGFFIVLLGAPFTPNDASSFVPVALLIGGLILFALLTTLVLLRADGWKHLTAPWFSVALFGLFFAATVTAGRSVLGLMYAHQPRYITGTVLVSVAVIQLGRLACVHKGSQAYVFLLGALWSLVLIGSIGSLAVASHLKQERSHAKLFLEILHYIDPAVDGSPKSPVYPLYPAAGIRPWADLLNESGFLHLASDAVFVDRACADCGFFESADSSADLLHVRRSKNEITVSGWASLPGGRGLPKIVLISYDNQKTFITGAGVGSIHRPDIAALRKDPRYLHAGWSVTFPVSFLPAGDGILKAWVYDATENKFIRLPESGGEKRFKVEAQ